MHTRAVKHLQRADPVMAKIIDRVGSCHFRPRAEGTHFHAVLRSIVYQQLSGSAAFTIHSRFVALYGDEDGPSPAELLATPDEQLRGVGLSRQKIAYMKDLAARVERGEVPIERLHELEDDAVIAALTSVKGVGRWTAQMFLMFRLGRPNVLPELDLGVRKAIQRAFRMRKLPSVDRVRRVGAAWAPHCTIASWYLWRSLEVDGASATPARKRQGAGAGRKNGAGSKRRPTAKRPPAR